MALELTKDQQKAYDYIMKGHSIFITGQGGVGKSLILSKLKTRLWSKDMAITSTTGRSALLIEGTTLHSYLGIGLGLTDEKSMADSISGFCKKRWKKLEILVIDEISMLSPVLFDKLEYVARTLRKNDLPFGGIQLILSGDFCQLPVVNETRFCFEAKTWSKCISRVVYLREIMRQQDAVFQQCLSEIRLGKITRNTENILFSRKGIKLTNTFDIRPTKLFCTNAKVDAINEDELDKLAEDGREFKQYDMEINILHPKVHSSVIERYKKNCNCQVSIQLCMDAQVMLVCNLDPSNKLVNGSRGVIVGFVNDYPLVRFLGGYEIVITDHIWDCKENGVRLFSIKQIPLKLAYAFTIHKAQGITLDYAELDLSEVFEYGQAYCALSRVRTLEGLSLSSFDVLKIKAHPKAVEYYEALEKDMKKEEIPDEKE